MFASDSFGLATVLKLTGIERLFAEAGGAEIAAYCLLALGITLALGFVLSKPHGKAFLLGVARTLALPFLYFGEGLRRITELLGSKWRPERGWLLDGTMQGVKFTWVLVLVLAAIALLPATFRTLVRDPRTWPRIEQIKASIEADEENIEKLKQDAKAASDESAAVTEARSNRVANLRKEVGEEEDALKELRSKSELQPSAAMSTLFGGILGLYVAAWLVALGLETTVILLRFILGTTKLIENGAARLGANGGKTPTPVVDAAGNPIAGDPNAAETPIGSSRSS